MIKNIKATGLELTEAINSYVDEKVTHLEKYLDGEGENAIADIEVGKTTGHHKAGEVFKAEINLVAGGRQYYVVAEEEDLYAAIDVMKDKIAEKLSSDHQKKKSLVKRGGRAIKNLLKGLTWGK